MESPADRSHMDVVHMLWVGEGSIPDFHFRCISSYVAVGNDVHLWVYPEQHPDRSALPAGATLRNANEVIPLETALAIGYFHGMGPELRWPSWSTFADLFRYELLFKEVRRLQDADFPATHVFATEKWRPGGYRNIILAVPKPGTPIFRETPEFINDASKEEAAAWRQAVDESDSALLRSCSVLTNSHIRAPCGSRVMRACADQLRQLMEAYAEEGKCHAWGDANVDWSLPTGGEGLRIFQEVIACSIEAGGSEAIEFLAAVQHYAVFNPCELDDFPGALRVLKGERHVPACTCAVHIFGMIRDNFRVLKFQVPNPFAVVQDDNDDQLLLDIKKAEALELKAQRELQRQERMAKKLMAQEKAAGSEAGAAGGANCKDEAT
eukprot:gnl/TRDRNA2_/TRDRNA2_85008_c0_seq1.p1 gnl/TRDRNA2_/TRDRNA2_85008_c0~~gnl/TRDRNA2_/TRDRNA2_85008_c0_seq1.p1  ORF type:complete len:408 (+),score=91.77 gnl/TRDRNA2_/TRDRNA2_85008_c0_seq1:85-1224(+)